MIEKLDLLKMFNERKTDAQWNKAVEITVNQLVDAVNKHEDIIRQIGEWGTSKGECLWCANLTEVNLDDRMIGCTTLDIPESYKTDPYARQRKCICKLCWFWNDDKANKVIGILTGVFDEADRPFERSIDQTLYKHCEPVKPDDDIIYKGGDNE